MEVLLVRHGETRGNVARRHQADDTPLTATGREQAKKIAQELSSLQPTHVLTSNMVRAIETAREIADECDITPETSESFRELHRPSRLYGRYRRSFVSLWYYFLWYFGIEKDDGETYAALRDRFKAAQSELAAYPSDARIIVVSHAAFMRLFVAHLCDFRALSPLRAAGALIKMLMLPNTHVIRLVYNGEAAAGKCGWSVEQA